MNRRMALMLGFLTGGLAPSLSRGQDDLEDPLPKSKPKKTTRPVSNSDSDVFDDGAAGSREPLQDSPPDFRPEVGHSWKNFDIANYASLGYSPENPKPQNAIVEWIFRRTGSAVWHGEKIAVLSAGKAQLRAYHNAKVLKVVQEYVERFTRATADVLSVRVRFVAAQDTRWRYSVYNRLKRIGTGPQGQQLWTISADDANLVRTQMMLYQGFKLLADKTVKVLNGQTLLIETADDLNFVSSTQSEGASGVGAQPKTDQLKEGAFLRFSPLLTYDGDAVDAAVDFRATTVKRLIRTKVLAKKDVGPTDVTIDVPEVVETRLNRTVENWTLGQTLLISAGITPGILQSKTGFMNMRLPGTVPTDTEMLVFIDIEPDRKSNRSKSKRDPAMDDSTFDDPPPRSSTKRPSNPTPKDEGEFDDPPPRSSRQPAPRSEPSPFDEEDPFTNDSPAPEQVTRSRTSRDDF